MCELFWVACVVIVVFAGFGLIVVGFAVVGCTFGFRLCGFGFLVVGAVWLVWLISVCWVGTCDFEVLLCCLVFDCCFIVCGWLWIGFVSLMFCVC